MIQRSIVFPTLSSISLAEVLVVLVIASVAYFLLFNNFEKHLRIQKRFIKLFVVVGVLASIGILFGRFAFWGIIVLMTIGQIHLHGWYFPKHGVNGLTAEPYEKYLQVIEKMKGNSR